MLESIMQLPVMIKPNLSLYRAKRGATFAGLLTIAMLVGPVDAQSTEDSRQAESNVPYEGVSFRRWSAVVSDLDETIFLYTRILGLTLGNVSVDPKSSYVYEVFNIDRSIETRHATFHAGESQRVISVVEVPGQALNRPPALPRMSVALLNANGRFDAIVELLEIHEYEILSPHKLGKTGIEIGFIDRDGHLYALYEYPYRGCQHAVAAAASC